MTAVLFEKRGHVAIVTLNRPEARNAMAPESIVRLERCWDDVEADDEIRVAVLTGAGDRAFCAGADLARLIPLLSGTREPEDEWDRILVERPRSSSRAVLRDRDVGVPVIAAINGTAVAGGLELVLGTDLRVAADHAKFGVPEVRRALFPGGGSTYRLPQQLPFARAMELLLTGETFDADEALRVGFVNRVVPGAEVLDTALALADAIAANGPLAVQAIRRSARACLGLQESEASRLEIEYSGPIMRSDDAIEGARAFMEKRAPVYRGT